MPDSSLPVEWHGRQAVVVLPEHVDLANAGPLRDQLLVLINRGAAVVILDMTSTISCDHAGMDAIARAYQRATINGTTLRLAVAAPIIRRVLSIEGLDRLVSIFPTVTATLAAGPPPEDEPAAYGSRPGDERANGLAPQPALDGMTPALLWQVIDALGDGLAMTRHDGEIVLVNRRCAEMFGYQKDELVGKRVEALVPADLRAVHERERAQYALRPTARPMAARARLVGVRKDGATIPVEISLSPVPTTTGELVLAVIRDSTPRRRSDLADLARAAAAEQTRRSRELLDAVVSRLFEVGVSLQAAATLPEEVARNRITEALARLDDTIHEIRSYEFDELGDDSVT